MSEKLAVFPTNLGMYNEGKLVGGWLELPKSQKEIQDFLKDEANIGAPDAFGVPYEEMFITDYELPGWAIDMGLNSWLNSHGSGEYASLEAMNAVALLGETLPDEQLEAVGVLMDTDSSASLDDVLCWMVNSEDIPYCQYTVGEYEHWSPNDYEKLGYSLADANGLTSRLQEMDVQYYFDYESYGRDMSQDFCLGPNGYVDARFDPKDLLMDHDDLVDELNSIDPEIQFGTSEKEEER